MPTMPVRAVPWGRPLPPMWMPKGRVPPGKAAGQPGHALLRACPRLNGRRTVFWVPASLRPPPLGAVLPELRDRGDIDFIFGGADALFEQCILRTVDNHLSHSYITAPGQRQRAGLRVLGLRFRLRLPRRNGLSGQALAAHRQDCHAGLPPWSPHCTGGLFRLE